MPELPEVETVKETLKKRILKKRINKIKILYDGIIASDIDEFKNKIIGETINDISRRGKWLIFELDNYYLLSHLRMEGKFFLKSFDEKIVKHEHVIFFLDDISLRYHDTRKFGKMYLVEKDKLYTDTPLSKQGLEPWDDNLTINYLKDKYNRNISVKTLLLDQEVISGIGNIYADEILFMSKINPCKKGTNLSDVDCDNIIKNTRTVLEKAIELGGTTIRSYTSSLGVTGRFQNELLVHQRENEECYTCKSKIVKTKVNGRGTYYCPVCQKEENTINSQISLTEGDL